MPAVKLLDLAGSMVTVCCSCGDALGDYKVARSELFGISLQYTGFSERMMGHPQTLEDSMELRGQLERLVRGDRPRAHGAVTQVRDFKTETRDGRRRFRWSKCRCGNEPVRRADRLARREVHTERGRKHPVVYV